MLLESAVIQSTLNILVIYCCELKTPFVHLREKHCLKKFSSSGGVIILSLKIFKRCINVLQFSHYVPFQRIIIPLLNDMSSLSLHLKEFLSGGLVRMKGISLTCRCTFVYNLVYFLGNCDTGANAQDIFLPFISLYPAATRALTESGLCVWVGFLILTFTPWRLFTELANTENNSKRKHDREEDEYMNKKKKKPRAR